ncbi:M48 family metallopeptidase [Gangjinia marincola]|uniref:M48 family metallopeptidase n=1 Tax=Gangjinia marincola TaxID=578463 RepID=A0ABN1MDC6_9FLAO
MIKKITLVVLLMATVASNAQFKKLTKAQNVKAAKKAVKAATLTDEEIQTLSLQSVEWMDTNNPVAGENDPYAMRLNALIKDHFNEDGLTLNYKVYNVVDINAFATPDGSIRIMAGLMDLMTDNELLSVIGHEIGHVKLGHSKKRYQSAYAISAGKDVAQANTGVGQVLADDEIGGFVENLLNAQFSQSNESASDEYGFDFLVDHDYNYHAMTGAFEKLAALSADGGKSSMMSSHPGAAKRATRAKEWAEKQDAKE